MFFLPCNTCKNYKRKGCHHSIEEPSNFIPFKSGVMCSELWWFSSVFTAFYREFCPKHSLSSEYLWDVYKSFSLCNHIAYALGMCHQLPQVREHIVLLQADFLGVLTSEGKNRIKQTNEKMWKVDVVTLPH